MHSPSRNRPRFPRQSRAAPRWGAFLLLFALIAVIGLFVWRCTSSADQSPAQPKRSTQGTDGQTSARQTPQPPASRTASRAQPPSGAARNASNPNFALSSRVLPKEGAIPILMEMIKKELPAIARMKGMATAPVPPARPTPPSAIAQPASQPVIKQGAILLLTDITYKELPRIAAQLEAQAKPLQTGAVLALMQKTSAIKLSFATQAGPSSKTDLSLTQHPADANATATAPATKTGGIELLSAIVAAEQLPAYIAKAQLPRLQPTPEPATAPSISALPTQSTANAAPSSSATPSAPSSAFSPSHAAEVDNPWGLPFVGFPLEDIALTLSERYAGRQPKLWGEHLPGVVSKLDPKAYSGSTPVVALTLDACDGKSNSSYDASIIAFLREKRIPATIFVTSKWMQSNKRVFAELAKDSLFEIAAHGVAHKPCSVNGRSVYGIKGTASMLELVTEVETNLRDIQRITSSRPVWFRSGTAFYDDIAISVIHDLGAGVAGYSIAADEGATLSAASVAKKILSAQHTDILLLHLNHPQSGTREGLRQALPLLQEKGYRFVTLSGA